MLIKIRFEVTYQNITKNWIHVNYIPGGWGVYNQMYFLFTSWWIYNRWGYKRKFTVYKNNWNYNLAVDQRSFKHQSRYNCDLSFVMKSSCRWHSRKPYGDVCSSHSSFNTAFEGCGRGGYYIMPQKIIWLHLFSQNAILWVSLYPTNNFLENPPGWDLKL